MSVPERARRSRIAPEKREVWCSVVMRVASRRDEAVLAQLAALDSQRVAVAPARPAWLVIEQLEQRMNQLQDKVA
jgi:hypothetical protein